MNSISKSALESDSVISTQFIQSGAFTWLNGPKEINAAPAIDIYSSSNLHVDMRARAGESKEKKKAARSRSACISFVAGSVAAGGGGVV
jgi:hypothetical protein